MNFLHMNSAVVRSSPHLPAAPSSSGFGMPQRSRTRSTVASPGARVLALIAVAVTLSPVRAAAPRALPEGRTPDDVRLQPLKDLKGYFPLRPPSDRAEWGSRAGRVRRQVLVSQGLWPMPAKTPLNAIIHGRIERPEYTVEKVYFESVPGLFVTGNLYRPKGRTGSLPAVLFAHGHWRNARLFEETDEKLRQEIATGQERFWEGGRNRFQAMCVQLVRMGCVVWQWDMLGDSDSQQLPRSLVHRFATQRPEMNTRAGWGFFSPLAEAHLQSVMGLQTLNSVRSLDFVLSLPEVDPGRIAITGASGGGTQTMLLAAIDSRVALSFPAVMVSTAMQGGCTCENASLLRVNTGNIEFAALFAPKPQGMTTARDWTREMAVKGFPQLKEVYALLGSPDNVMLHRGEHFPHNYNAVSRSAFFTWLNRHFHLGQVSPVIESDYQRISPAELNVWDGQHPAPEAAGPALERTLTRWLRDDAQRQLDAADPIRFRRVVGAALEIVLGGRENPGEVEWRETSRRIRNGTTEAVGLLRNRVYQEVLPAVLVTPARAGDRVVVWISPDGKAGLYAADGTLSPPVRKLVDAGDTVLGMDLLYQGEFLPDGQPLVRTPRVKNPREAAAYTYGYNHAVFVHRVHDILTAVHFAHLGPRAGGRVALVGLEGAGHWVAAARVQAGERVERAVIDTGGFRFARIMDIHHLDFLPGGAKYGDIPGMLAMGAPRRVWIAGEDADGLALARRQYQAVQAESLLTRFQGPAALRGDAAVDWLLEK
jgi:dienelactone hydrolase